MTYGNSGKQWAVTVWAFCLLFFFFGDTGKKNFSSDVLYILVLKINTRSGKNVENFFVEICVINQTLYDTFL